MKVLVDVIIPVHNAENTIKETITSAMKQCIPTHLLESCDDTKNPSLSSSYHYLDGYNRCCLKGVDIDVAVCCFDDGSSDQSFDIMKSLKEQYDEKQDDENQGVESSQRQLLVTKLYIDQSQDGIGRGAGYARNHAASLRYKHEIRMTSSHTDNNNINKNKKHSDNSFICLLDSDDVMHPNRIAEQISVMLSLSPQERHSTILGCTFERIPNDSTWHYTYWANNLTNDRLYLERFREVTVLQPTWMMDRLRFNCLGGYIEAPHPHHTHPMKNIKNDNNMTNHDTAKNDIDLVIHHHNNDTHNKNCDNQVYKLIHPIYDDSQSLRLAEDLRLFHAHLLLNCTCFHHNSNNNSNGGKLKLIRTKEPLLKYRHRIGQSQSSSTSRKLLLQLRTKAFVDTIVQPVSNNCSCNSSSRNNSKWCYSNETKKGGFVIWGAGRDGKEFYKSLSDEMKCHVRCFVDVDEKKINSGYYIVPHNNEDNNKNIIINNNNIEDKELNDNNKKRKEKKDACFKVPIVHFSLLVKDDTRRNILMNEWMYPNESKIQEEDKGRITKDNPTKNYVFLVSKRMKINNNDDDDDDHHHHQYQPLSPNLKEYTNNMKHKQSTTTPKRKLHAIPKKDKENLALIMNELKDLPVVVCVAMYRSNGVLEKNVESIGRKEGVDLWHFS